MSERPPEKRSEFENELSEITLPTSQIDRDALMYQAGFAAGQTQFRSQTQPIQHDADGAEELLTQRPGEPKNTKTDFWKWTAGGLATLSGVLAAGLFFLISSGPMNPVRQAEPGNEMVKNLDRSTDRDDSSEKNPEPNAEPKSKRPLKNGVQESSPAQRFIDPVFLVQRPIRNFSSSLLTMSQTQPLSTKVMDSSTDEELGDAETLKPWLSIRRQSKIRF